jgi:hypothetical protein
MASTDIEIIISDAAMIRPFQYIVGTLVTRFLSSFLRHLVKFHKSTLFRSVVFFM